MRSVEPALPEQPQVCESLAVARFSSGRVGGEQARSRGYNPRTAKVAHKTELSDSIERLTRVEFRETFLAVKIRRRRMLEEVGCH